MSSFLHAMAEAQSEKRLADKRVASKRARGDRALQIRIGGRDHPHVSAKKLSATDSQYKSPVETFQPKPRTAERWACAR